MPASCHLRRVLAFVAPVALVALVALLACVARAVHRRRDQPSFATVAPVFYTRCGPCHRPGESAPFPLITYADIHRRARQIARVTTARYMPPWKPVAGYAHYRDDRSLAPAELALLQRWIAAGAPEGDPRRVPAPPRWPTGWQLGTPDVVVRLPEAFNLPADGPDVFRNFVLPSPVQGVRFVAAWEFRAGGRSIHHAILNVDHGGWARRRDAEDPGPGFEGMDPGNVQSPDGFYLVWTPGRHPTAPSPGAAWRIDGGTDLVLQLHLHPTGRAESVRPTLGLYFATAAPSVPRMTFRLGDKPIDIPAGDARWTMTDDATLPADVVLLGLFPHAHYLARTMRSWATLPDGRTLGLLHIDDWDPAWQEEYTFANPLLLPRGTTVHMAFGYNNSAANERNPNDPPRRVLGGEQSTDEMGNITYEAVPRDPADLDVLQVFKYQRLVGTGARGEYNLANALSRVGRADEAITHYRRAIAQEPDLDPAHNNLGNLLLARGDRAGAIAEYHQVLRLRPDTASTRTNLANALRDDGQLPAALDEVRRAIAADPGFLPARVTLAVTLARAGQLADAADAWRAALSLAPGDPGLQRSLADAQSARDARDARLPDGGAQ